MSDRNASPETTNPTGTDGLQAWERSERRGNYALLTGIMLTAIIGFAAFSVDISLITMAELQAQSTADAASHAALLGYRINNRSMVAGNAAATWITNYNKVGLGTATLDSVQYGEWNFTNSTFTNNGGNGPVNAARASVSRTGGNSVRLLLAPLLGVNTYPVDATAVTSQQNRAMMLVMDMSCSMMGTWNDPNVAINVARVANQQFVDYIVQNPIRGDLIGLSMFGQKAVSEPTSPTDNGGGINTDYPNNTQVPWLRLTEIGLTGNEAVVRARMNGICETSNASNKCSYGAWPAAPHPASSEIGACTNPGPAMRQAVNELVLRADNTYFKAMIFFSDGEPNCNANGGGTDYVTRAYAESDSAWSNGIYVWTILYHNGSFDPQFMVDLVRGAPVAFASMTPNAQDLPVIYQTVAKSLPTALVY